MRHLACITMLIPPSSAAFADEGDVHFDFVVAPQLGWLTHPLAATDADADEAGAFVLTVGPHSGPTLVCATGGIYTEEATGGLVQLGTNELCSLIDDHTLPAAHVCTAHEALNHALQAPDSVAADVSGALVHTLSSFVYAPPIDGTQQAINDSGAINLVPVGSTSDAFVLHRRQDGIWTLKIDKGIPERLACCQ